MTVRTVALWILASCLAWLLLFVLVVRELGEAIGA